MSEVGQAGSRQAAGKGVLLARAKKGEPEWECVCVCVCVCECVCLCVRDGGLDWSEASATGAVQCMWQPMGCRAVWKLGI